MVPAFIFGGHSTRAVPCCASPAASLGWCFYAERSNHGDTPSPYPAGFDADELSYLIQRAIKIKTDLKANGPEYAPLANRTLAMIFEIVDTYTCIV